MTRTTAVDRTDDSLRSRFLWAMRKLGLMPVVNGMNNLVLSGIKGWCRLTGRDPMVAIYDAGYFRAETDMTLPTAGIVVDFLMEEFAPASVIDVGCGTAVYLADFERRGVEVRGVEGSPRGIEHALIDPNKVVAHDLTCELTLPERFDLVTCFEVGEHLAASAAPILARSLAGLGSVLAFSAAQPNQGGVDHVNEQPPSYWVDQFERAGMTLDEVRTGRARAHMEALGGPWWLRNNLLVFTGPGTKLA